MLAARLSAVHLTLVTETFPPEVNGVAMTLGRLTSGLTRLGWTVEVIRPRQAGETGEGHSSGTVASWLVPGVPIPFYRSLRMGLPLRGPLLRRFAERPPDVVHIATEGPLGLAALSAAQSLGLAVTSSFHTNFHQYGSHYGLKQGRSLALRYLRWFHNRTACTLVPTEEMRQDLARQGFERLGIMARGVDSELFNPNRRSEALRQSWGAGPEVPVFLHVGRMAAEKNLQLAIDAFYVFKQQLPSARFVWVGDGPERMGMAKKYPEFHFAGMRRGEELATHYASSDCFIFPSETETFGNVLTEAMASGLVTLAYDYAAPRSYLAAAGAGWLAKYRDREAFLRGATQLASCRSEWPAMRREARRRMEAITWDAVVARFAEDLTSAATGVRSPDAAVAGAKQ